VTPPTGMSSARRQATRCKIRWLKSFGNSSLMIFSARWRMIGYGESRQAAA
jgi:hypothetical protein